MEQQAHDEANQKESKEKGRQEVIASWMALALAFTLLGMSAWTAHSASTTGEVGIGVFASALFIAACLFGAEAVKIAYGVWM